MKADLIIHNAQLVTCASNGKPKRLAAMQDVGLIEDGAVVSEGGKIIAVGKSADILDKFTSFNVIDAQGNVVCPGFVDPHTHIVFAGNRLNEFELKIKGADYLEILANGGGILSTVKQTREASLENLIVQSRQRLDKMLECGTTTAEIKTGYGLDTETELKMLEAILKLDRIHNIEIIPTFLAAHAVPTEFKENPDEYVRIICDEMLKRAISVFFINKFDFSQLESDKDEIKDGLSFDIYKAPESELTSLLKIKPFFIDVFCEKNAFNLEQTKRILEAAKSFGFKLKAHVDEFTNLGGSKLCIEMGATSIDHLDAISDEEIELLANSETVGIVTPTVNFNFGSTHFADARKFIDAGCAVALSTDYNPGSAPCPSQPMAAQIACRYQKLLPAEAFNAITINSAFGLGLGDKIGSLEVGKQADILLLETKDYREICYEFGSNFVQKVFKRGEEVYSA